MDELGSKIAEYLSNGDQVEIEDKNGTDLKFSIKGRYPGIEIGTLTKCFSEGKECRIDIPAGEVYIAPLEDSTNGILVVDELKDFNICGLKLRFENGIIKDFKAKRGAENFKKMLENGEGGKDRIGELGIGLNYGLKPIGWRLFDEKIRGTAHLAIGDNIGLGGTNKASLHLDFVLYNPTLKVDGKPLNITELNENE